MADALRKMSPGQKLPQFPAALFNDMVDAVRDFRARQQFGQIDGEGRTYTPGIDVRVENGTGDGLSQFSIVRIGAGPITPADNQSEAFEKPNITGLAPVGSDLAFAVLQEPIQVGGIGAGRVAGVTWASVHVLNVAHRFAKPAAGTTGNLVSSGVGGAPILTPVSATGTQWCLIRLEAACDCGDSGSGGDDGGGGPVTDCLACQNGALEQYCTRFPGVTNGSCPDCAAAWDTEIILAKYVTPCTWSSGVLGMGEACPGAHGQIVNLTYDDTLGDEKWIIEVTHGLGNARYEASHADTVAWDCSSPLAMTLASSTMAAEGLCDNWPSNITVGPCVGGGGGGGGGDVTGLGSASSGDDTGVTTLTMDGGGGGVAVAAGTLLTVRLMIVQTAASSEFAAASATWNGHALAADKVSFVSDGGNFIGVVVFSYHVTTAATADITVTLAHTRVCAMNATQTGGLADFAVDANDDDTGTTGTPTLGVTTGHAHEYLNAAAALKNLTTGDWGGDLASGGQDVTVSLAGNSYTLTEADLVSDTAGTYGATLDGTDQDDYAAALVTYS